MAKNIVCCVCKKSECDVEGLHFFRFVGKIFGKIPNIILRFSFPKTQQLKEKWIKILDIKHKVIPENYAVCSLHFLNSDIKDVDGTPTLKRTAVPLNKTYTYNMLP